MSVTKAQLVGGVGISTVGDLTVFGAVNASGSVTASSFVGNLTGTASTATASATSFGLSGTPNITVGFITATGTSISGNVNVGGNVSIAGTLTYEDVTNIDSIGIVTARAGIVLGPTANTIRLGTGTTISSPASDTFTILTGGSERVRVSSAGSFGVGTPSPSAPAHIIATGGSTNSINIGLIVDYEATAAEQTGAGTAILFRGKSSGGNIANYDQAQISTNNFGTNNAHGLSFYYKPSAGGSLTEGLRLDSGGRLGIGVSGPLERLHVSGNIIATGDITAFYSSDIRLKKDIEPISEPIKKLMEISGVTYKWNEEYLKDKEVDGYFVRETEVGVIAQEVEKVLPEVVATRENGYKAVRYEKLVALLIEAVKDQQHQIDELKARLEEK